jgi:hypothetical protein
MACPALQYFSILPHKRYDFRKKVIEHEICVLIFSTTSIRNISHYRKDSARHGQKCAYFHVKHCSGPNGGGMPVVNGELLGWVGMGSTSGERIHKTALGDGIGYLL